MPQNRLAEETSPYLLQHAHNPVDWFPWGEGALNRAREQNKPILLSIGYAACHWCHVMERESFENDSIAAQMNADFVCVKVDREERPDLDEIYMRAVQAFSGGHGGWPMTVFLTPQGVPFWGGTYFPPTRRGGLPGFDEVLTEMARLWQSGQARVEEITEQMQGYLARTSGMPQPEGALTADWLDRVVVAAAEQFDRRGGGFGTRPKFPSHGLLPTLLAHGRVRNNPHAIRMVTDTLHAMAAGGVYDLLAGGFARYSVDADWRVPHFEKMLYDNAQLLRVYADAWVATGEARFAKVARGISRWMLEELRLDSGGFAASLDADTEGHEGTFYVWTPAQVVAVLGQEDGQAICDLLEVTEEGTFEGGASVLRLETPVDRLAPELRALLERSLPRLLDARNTRERPARNGNAITSWNGLAIGALARAGAQLDEPSWVEAASAAGIFVLEHAVAEGRLMRVWNGGRAHTLGCADDHANLINGLLDLWEATFDQRWLVRANQWADALVELFWDEQGGGLYFTGSDAPALVTRSKNLAGGAEPSANESAALAFVRLGRLCGREDLSERAAVICAGLQPTLMQAPAALGAGALAAHWLVSGGVELGINGDVRQEDTQRLLTAYRSRYVPFSVVAVRRKDEPYALLPWMRGKPRKSVAMAMLCEGWTCRLPTDEAEVLATQLEEALQPPPETDGRAVVHAPPWTTDEAHWINGEPLSLESLRGNVVVLDFWTHCCVNCVHVLPALADVEERFATEPVAVIGVHSAKFDVEKQAASVSSAVERYRIRHPVLLDPDHDLWSLYAVRAWPTVVVIDPTGRIAWQQSGEVSSEVLGRVVDEVLETARQAGTLGEAVWRAPELTATQTDLRFPGKVHCWSRGGVLDEHSRVYVSDTGHDQVVEYQPVRSEGGEVHLHELRRFDGFCQPQGLARWRNTLYVADAGSHRLLTVDLVSGEVRAAVGNGRLGRGGSAPSDQPLTAELRSPWDVVVSGDVDNHVVLVAMAGSHQIWVYAPEIGRITPLAGSGREEHIDGPFEQAALAQPSGLSLLGPYLFFADSEVSSVRVLDLRERTVGTLVGQGLFDFGDVDGVGTEVRLQHPMDVVAFGNRVYVADTFNHKVKSIDLHDNRCETVAGGDGRWNEPGGLDCLDGVLFVADTNHHRIDVLPLDTSRS